MDLRKLLDSLNGEPIPYVKPPPAICQSCPTRVRPGSTLCKPCEKRERNQPGTIIEAQLGSAHWAQPKPLPAMDYSKKAVVRKIKKMRITRNRTKELIRNAMVALGRPATFHEVSVASGFSYLVTTSHVRTIARHVGSAPSNGKKRRYLWQL